MTSLSLASSTPESYLRTCVFCKSLKKTGKKAKIILRIKERRLLAAMFQETWKAGSEVRENEGIALLENGLATKVCPCGSQGAAIALGPEARSA